MAGVLIGSISSISYALDAYRESSNELFIMNMLFKNFMFYGISYVANDWVVREGPFNVLAVCGGTSVALVSPRPLCALSRFSAFKFLLRSFGPCLLLGMTRILMVVCPRVAYLDLGKEIAQLLGET